MLDVRCCSQRRLSDYDGQAEAGNILNLFKGEIMISKDSNGGFKVMQPGVEFKTLVYGDKTHMIKAILKKGGDIRTQPSTRTDRLFVRRTFYSFF